MLGGVSSTPINPNQPAATNSGDGNTPFNPTMGMGGAAANGAEEETPAEGCHCDLSDRSTSSASWLAVFALLALRPRRRRRV